MNIIISIWDNLTYQTKKLVNIIRESRLHYDFRMPEILPKRLKEDIEFAAQESTDLNAYEASARDLITNNAINARNGFQNIAHNKKVSARFTSYLSDRDQLSPESIQNEFQQKLTEYKNRWNEGSLKAKIERLRIEWNQANDELTRYFTRDGRPFRKVIIKSYPQRVFAIFVIITVLLIEVAINTLTLSDTFAGVKDAGPIVTVVSLFNTLVPFWLAIYLTAFDKNISIFKKSLKPLVVLAVVSGWAYVNALLCKMRYIADQITALELANKLEEMKQWQELNILTEAFGFNLQYLGSFTTVQLFIVAVLAFGISYHHGKNWRDSDKEAHILALGKNKLEYKLTTTIEDARDFLTNLNTEFDDEINNLKKNRSLEANFINRVNIKLNSETREYEAFTEELESRYKAKLIRHYEAIYNSYHEDSPIESSRVKNFADNVLLEVENILSDWQIASGIDEDVFEMAGLITDQQLNEARNQVINNMDEFDARTKTMLDDVQGTIFT